MSSQLATVWLLVGSVESKGKMGDTRTNGPMMIIYEQSADARK
jgi:hypothetical protein